MKFGNSFIVYSHFFDFPPQLSQSNISLHSMSARYTCMIDLLLEKASAPGIGDVGGPVFTESDRTLTVVDRETGALRNFGFLVCDGDIVYFEKPCTPFNRVELSFKQFLAVWFPLR